jgi:triosephosphate isomerase
METPLIIANWKSNMTQKEAVLWIEQMKQLLSQTQKKVVICPPFTLLSSFFQHNITTISLGAQDISPLGMGAYTGEVNGEQIKEFASYVIIGHSERRKYFKEDDEMLTQKVDMAKKSELIPVFCVQGSDTFIPEGVTIVAYEPIWAIGSGKAESPDEANEVAKAIKQKTSVATVLYGGSVTGDNVHSFTEMSDLSGVLVGGASLDPQKFSHIISNA